MYVEIISSVYYNNNKTSDVNNLLSKVENSLTSYSDSVEMNKFGGRFKFSKVQQVIDTTDTAITSNITKVLIRRNLKIATNQLAQYELCYGNQFHVNSAGRNIKSTGFYVATTSRPVYITAVSYTHLTLPTSDLV